AGHRVIFRGEVPFTEMPDYFRHADLFLHASLSETFGNVLGEALWCGTPTVAFADGMGVNSQIRSGVNGVLLAPGQGGFDADADANVARNVIALLGDAQQRARLSGAAARIARERSSPAVVQRLLAEAFIDARHHAEASGLRPLVDRSRVLQWQETFRRF